MIRMQPLTKAQAEKMIRLAFAESTRNGLLLTICLHHATRASELASLRVENVNLKDEVLFISRRKGSESKPESLVNDEKKLLENYLDGRTTGLLFPSEKTGQLSTVQVYRIFRRYAELAGVPDSGRSPHAFRHTLGQLSADAGISLPQLQVIMGHKSAQSTLRYFKVKQSVADAAKAKVFA
jgi:integrase